MKTDQEIAKAEKALAYMRGKLASNCQTMFYLEERGFLTNRNLEYYTGYLEGCLHAVDALLGMDIVDYYSYEEAIETIRKEALETLRGRKE